MNDSVRPIGKVLRANTRGGAKRNIAYHYDLGNSFYAQWLDPTMTYSSAVFAEPAQDLAAAQVNKYRLVAEKLPLEQQLFIVREAFETVLDVSEAYVRSEAFDRLAPLLTGMIRSQLYTLWQPVLRTLSTRTRQDLLGDLRALLPVLERLGGTPALVQTFQAVREVGQRWP